ncbi:peroxiredoxin family protein [Flectobacillus major]|uniref:peroxiredoxin family protein n=1 Tax=Flectobacillus major TaxID=103 RepID=UPI0003F84F53|nr:TlpA disulfide reductase family protein [Flectobacillus major]
MKSNFLKGACQVSLLSLSLASVSFATEKPILKEGKWRGEFKVNETRVPFNFEIKGKSIESATLTLLNGSRRDDFQVKTIAGDSIFVKMNTYDAALVGKIDENGAFKGVYKSLVPNFRGNSLPFVAEYGKTYRFVEPGQNQKPVTNVSGKWNVKIISKDPNAANSVALLEQKGNKLTGVLMTVVGDTRELEGTIQGNEFRLSGFTGPSPVAIRGKINDDLTSISDGEISFGIYVTQKFEAVKDNKATLPDPYKLTFLKEGYKKLDFTFPDLTGKQVSLSDDKYKGKVVIVEIIGTWCPNCTDQTRFLSPWFKANKHRGVEAIAIGFEQKDDLEYAKYTLGKLRDFFGIEYDILFGGIADKKVATEKLAALNRMAAFPTTIIIDRNGDVREIYTGYTGEITGKYFKDYTKKFNKVLDALIAEPNPYEKATITTASLK